MRHEALGGVRPAAHGSCGVPRVAAVTVRRRAFRRRLHLLQKCVHTWRVGCRAAPFAPALAKGCPEQSLVSSRARQVIPARASRWLCEERPPGRKFGRILRAFLVNPNPDRRRSTLQVVKFEAQLRVCHLPEVEQLRTAALLSRATCLRIWCCDAPPRPSKRGLLFGQLPSPLGR